MGLRGRDMLSRFNILPLAPRFKVGGIYFCCGAAWHSTRSAQHRAPHEPMQTTTTCAMYHAVYMQGQKYASLHWYSRLCAVFMLLLALTPVSLSLGAAYTGLNYTNLHICMCSSPRCQLLLQCLQRLGTSVLLNSSSLFTASRACCLSASIKPSRAKL